jgi:hypothetical protein
LNKVQAKVITAQTSQQSNQYTIISILDEI